MPRYKSPPPAAEWTDQGLPLDKNQLIGWYHSSGRTRILDSYASRITPDGWAYLCDAFYQSCLDNTLVAKDYDLGTLLSTHRQLSADQPLFSEALSTLLDYIDQLFLKHTSPHSLSRHYSAIGTLANIYSLPSPLALRLTKAIMSPVHPDHLPSDHKFDIAISLLSCPTTPESVLDFVLHALRTHHWPGKSTWEYCERLVRSPNFSVRQDARALLYPHLLPDSPGVGAFSGQYSARPNTWQSLGFANIAVLTALIKNLGPDYTALILTEILTYQATDPRVSGSLAIKELLRTLPPHMFTKCPKSLWLSLLQHPDKDVRVAATHARAASGTKAVYV